MSIRALRYLTIALPDFTSLFEKNCALTKYVDITLTWIISHLPQMKVATDTRLMPWGYRGRSANNSTNITAEFIEDVRVGGVASLHYYGGELLLAKNMTPEQKMQELQAIILASMPVS